jgi:hypothetical protein
MIQRLRAFSLLGACALALGLAVPSAAEASYTLNIINTNPLGTGNFGTVDVVDIGTDVQITFTANNGKIGEIAFNTDETGLVITGMPASWTVSTDQNQNSMDGFGKFDITIGGNGNNDPGDRVVSVTVTIHKPSTDLAVSDFLFGSDGGDPDQSPAYFAAHYFPTVGNTYYIGTTDLVQTQATPAPASLVLALVGIAGLGGVGLRRRLRGQVASA